MPGVYRMSPTEISLGFVFGQADGVVFSHAERENPRAALERVIREHLLRPPCGVAFSGGRDSSTVLAIAVDVARREGLADPVPITRVFEGASRSEEREWQELVVRHLKIDNWERLPFTDELDLLGPYATRNVARHGVVWTPLIHANIPMLELLAGGSLLDGEGGDEVLGVRSHRVKPVNRLLRKPRNITPSLAKAAVRSFVPARLRAWRTRRHIEQSPHEWLTPSGQAAWIEALTRFKESGPLSHSASIRHAARARSAVLLVHNVSLLGHDRDVKTASPFLHPDVVDALARQAGWLGLGSRTDVLRTVVGDLLPDAILSRSSKAEFGQAYFASHSREFVERWDGGGVDTELVDVDGLRREWASDRPSALTSPLLQAAWWATESHRYRTANPNWALPF